MHIPMHFIRTASSWRFLSKCRHNRHYNAADSLLVFRTPQRSHRFYRCHRFHWSYRLNMCVLFNVTCCLILHLRIFNRHTLASLIPICSMHTHMTEDAANQPLGFTGLAGDTGATGATGVSPCPVMWYTALSCGTPPSSN